MKTANHRRNGSLAIAAVFAAVAAFAGVAASADDDDRSNASRSSPALANAPAVQMRSVTEVAAEMERQGYRDIREIEFDDGRYEVEATTSDGRRVELYVDALSLDIVGLDDDD